MDVRALRYFTEVVRQQSFTRAAQKLFVTQPTISKMVRQLEEELDCALLIRDGRRLHLTDSGQAVYQRGLAILQEFHQLEAEIGDINQLKTGKLRLGIPPMVGMQIAGSVSAFRRRYPGVELSIAEFGGLTVQEAVLAGTLDIALTALPVDAELPLETLSLMQHPLCVLLPRQAPWLQRTQLGLSDLASHPLLIFNEEFSLNRQLMKAFQRQGITPEIAVRSGQWDFLAAMVQAEMGLAILPEPICQRLDKQSLLWLPLESELQWHLGLIWREGSYLSRSARAWIACCREHWPDNAPRLSV
ncbi:LysR family transcriptional regulator [Pantoea allii]|uniref:DNA-binding transcriptional LysR family regulator n=1 Tax=Pantoea allii TaxID=574096 RepID=A0A2V2BPF5_9GAMM|nr:MULTISPECIES: LysR family transcriptional regulator [Pantoea]MBW1251141.1 LysR family transcriptional regulator [Pantoea allii]MBW1260926.1 LysR family transcriptional regulator [Pantoea allii]MBW1282335.1 LysR family transcriptional regulator [Pantoea allii]MCH9297201.1 LysR family transcriptional regulator [Pantoea allii]MDJ0036009.1 LysR family transcriptional regulator [Pantoea allii]